MFPGVPKFFVDAMTQQSENGDRITVPFPVDPNVAQEHIDEASAVLKEKLIKELGAELVAEKDRYIGTKALYLYLVSAIVGTAETIRSWNQKTATQLRSFVEKERKRLGKLVIPNDQASRLSVLRDAVSLYAKAWHSTVTADFCGIPSKANCTTSFDEHVLCANSSLCTRDLCDRWPLNNVRTEACLKLREAISTPALAVLRFRENEMPAVLREVMTTIAVGYSEEREKELEVYRGLTKGARYDDPRTIMIKAARAYLKGNEGLSDSLKYISARVIHLMCFLSMEPTIEELKKMDSSTAGSLDGSALYHSGLMRKGQPIYNWLENDAIFDYATSDRFASAFKVKFIMAQICEFGTQVQELDGSPPDPPEGVSLPQVRAGANKLIKTSLSRFGSFADFFVDTYATEIMERCVCVCVCLISSGNVPAVEYAYSRIVLTREAARFTINHSHPVISRTIVLQALALPSWNRQPPCEMKTSSASSAAFKTRTQSTPPCWRPYKRNSSNTFGTTFEASRHTLGSLLLYE
jgi:hypothetical protein